MQTKVKSGADERLVKANESLSQQEHKIDSIFAYCRQINRIINGLENIGNQRLTKQRKDSLLILLKQDITQLIRRITEDQQDARTLLIGLANNLKRTKLDDIYEQRKQIIELLQERMASLDQHIYNAKQRKEKITTTWLKRIKNDIYSPKFELPAKINNLLMLNNIKVVYSPWNDDLTKLIDEIINTYLAYVMKQASSSTLVYASIRSHNRTCKNNKLLPALADLERLAKDEINNQLRRVNRANEPVKAKEFLVELQKMQKVLFSISIYNYSPVNLRRIRQAQYYLRYLMESVNLYKKDLKNFETIPANELKRIFTQLYHQIIDQGFRG